MPNLSKTLSDSYNSYMESFKCSCTLNFVTGPRFMCVSHSFTVR
jgi:hypothetical protein